MQHSDVQRLLAGAKLYTGPIDNVIGVESWGAIWKLMDDAKLNVDGWGMDRLETAGAQLLLSKAGFNPGTIDGRAGGMTESAFLLWNHQQTYGKPLVLQQNPVRESPVKTKFPLQADCPTWYGPAGTPALEAQLTYIDPAYPMRLDWDLNTVLKSGIRLHKKCAESATIAFRLILAEYGLPKIRELGLDRFAGSFNTRQMRGGTSWSMHAYGAAIDFYALPNGLTTQCPQALFCGQAYKKFFDIWESVGWISLGREIGRDWMHVQAARLK